MSTFKDKDKQMDFKGNPEGFLAFLAAIGAVIGLGRLLSEESPVTLKIAMGRALVSGGLGAASGLVLAWFPEAPSVLLYGTAAAMASLGTSGVERVLLRMFNKE